MLSLIHIFLVELVKLANLIVQVSKALACAGRVQAVLDTTPGMAFPEKLLGEVPAEKSGDAVRFEHVSLTLSLIHISGLVLSLYTFFTGVVVA